ncbi:MAG: hypothetical protein FJ145_11740 [Deltaproteobacteria bacterium]|nr:hypothetical protein [Deltaproteobacteria bacterium]
MSEALVRQFAQEKAFHPQTLERWLTWEATDRDALWRLVSALKPSENHLRDLMDWLEEIALRDDRRGYEVLADKSIGDIETDPRLGRADKFKRIKEQLRRWRFPRLAEIEDGIQKRLKELKLQPEIQLSVPPGLEGGRLQIQFSAGSYDELKRLSHKLEQSLEQDAVRQVFDLLAGRSAK